MTAHIDTRRADLNDLEALLACVAAGFDSYRAFAPPGWEPPDREAGRALTADLLADPDTWGLIALVDETFVGHASFVPARERTPGEPFRDWRSRSLIPGLAHLGQLFILEPWWGRGVAPLLHDAALAEMRARGFCSARLFTPAGHARARSFYERRGWIAGEEGWDEHLRLALVEYRLDLGGEPQTGPQTGSQAPGSQPD